jgi:hypothetical protein|tara:strand:- start:1 stop:720 length:720 start_codon:yes stop_codon:yes gene_type:complete
MKKSNIVNNIQKYYLGGLSKGVIWNIKNNKVNISFTTETKDTVGDLVFDLNLDDCEIGINNTDALLRLLNITDEELQLELDTKETGLPTKLRIQDKKYDLDYNLSDPKIIEKVPNVQEIDYDFTFKINDEFVNSFLKAHNALEKINEFTLNTSITSQGENVVEIIIGERERHANKIKFTEPAEFETPSDLLPFSATVIREILSANKGNEGIASVSNKGLFKISFNTDESSVEYFVVRQQ